MNIRRLIALLALVAGLCGSASALDPSAPLTRYGHDVWDLHRGFPYFAVHAIHQTKDGYLWLATDDGLVRFDGVQFTQFGKSNTRAITNNDISSLAEDSAGRLWFGTRGGGLGRMDDGMFRAFTTNDGMAGNVVHALCLDRKGALWIGLESVGLNRLTGEAFTTFTLDKSTSAPTAYVICETNDSTFLLGAGGLLRRRSSSTQFEKIRFQDVLFVKAIFEDRKGVQWIGTSRGLYILEGDSTRKCTLPGAPASAPISCVSEDRDGNLWVGTEGDGLYRLSSGVFTRYTAADGLSSDRVLSIAEDREGNLWIGTRGGGLNRFRNQTLRTFSAEDGLAGDYVSALFEDSRGSLWVGVRDHGIDEVRNGAVVSRHTFGMNSGVNHVRAIAEDSKGNILLGTMNGLFMLTAPHGGVRTIVHPQGVLDSLDRYSIRAVIAGTDRQMLLGTYGGGVLEYSGGRLNATLSGKNVRAIAEAPDGTLWIAVKGGAYQIGGDRINAYTPAEGLSSDEAFSIRCENDGSVWVGTYGGGLNRIRKGKISAVRKEQGLFDDVVYSILGDGRGNFWIGCNRGIFRVPIGELNAAADGTLARVTCVSYGSEDGMRGVECNGGSQPSALRTRDGRLLFATVKGYVAVDPMNLRDNNTVIDFRIEQLIAERDTLPGRPTLQVAQGKRNLEIHYTGISFSGAEKLTFRYRMEGLDQGWTDAGTRRRAYFTNIPPGTYTFRVQAGSSPAPQSADGASMVIVIPPYFWETPWFRASAVLVIVVGVFVVARQISTKALKRRLRELESQQALENERSRISKDMHDEVGASLTQIAILAEQMERRLDANNAALSYLRKISATAQDVVGSLDEIVWFINPKHDTLESLLLYLREYLAVYFDSAELPCAFDMPSSVPQTACSADIRRNIFLVAKEAANNIVKHAGASEVSVVIHLSDGMLELRLSDNGVGADISGVSSFSNGLRNMQKRMEDVGGTLDITSAPKSGMSLRARVRLTPP